MGCASFSIAQGNPKQQCPKWCTFRGISGDVGADLAARPQPVVLIGRAEQGG
jgi:hypothetical protein